MVFGTNCSRARQMPPATAAAIPLEGATLRKLFIRAVCCFLMAALVACVQNTGPERAIKFAEISDIRQLLGYYRNEGDAGPDIHDSGVYLSALIWPDERQDHAAIEVIEITLEREDALRVTAIGKEGPIRTQVFVRDKDFSLRGGRISLGTTPTFLTDYSVGIAATQVWLGLEGSGDAAYRSTSGGVHLWGLLIPLAGGGRTDVRFTSADTLEDLLPAAGVASSNWAEAAGPVDNPALEEEIQKYLAALYGNVYAYRETAAAALCWSGISDPRLFDPMATELMADHRAKTKYRVNELCQLAAMLACSGNPAYRPVLETVASKSRLPQLSRCATDAVSKLARQAVWNPIILAGAERPGPRSLDELRTRNMLLSDEPALVRKGAEIVAGRFRTHRELLDATLASLERNRDRNLDLPLQEDAVIWLMKALASTGDMRYQDILEDIARNSPSTGIARYARFSADQLSRRTGP